VLIFTDFKIFTYIRTAVINRLFHNIVDEPNHGWGKTG